VTRRLASWAAILFLAGVALILIPGFDVLSFYFCLPIALLVGVAAGGVAVTAVFDGRESGHDRAKVLLRVAAATGILLAIPWVVITISSLVTGPCDYPYGLLFYLAGPVASAVCGAALGLAVGMISPTRRLAHVAHPLIVLATFVPDGILLFRHPAVFFYNPFLGWYPGPLYDDQLEVGLPYLAFRLFCLGCIVALMGLSHVLTGPDLKRRVSSRAGPWAILAAGILSAAILWSHSGALGFRVTRGDVEDVLSGVRADESCRIRHDPSLDPGILDRLLWDCGFQHRRVAAFFGEQPGAPIQVFVYRDADQKASLMGARYVEVAKPWLQEVHIAGTFPGDPVLGHEIAHVVAGRLAGGWLNLPLRFGVMPDMALVEGLAVAAAFADDGPSRHEWALAYTREGRAPEPEDFFNPLKFMGSGARLAYDMVGSFVGFVADHYGTEAIQSLARGEGFEAATGKTLAALAPEWREFLEAVAGDHVDVALQERAAGRFADPGVLRRRCPVDVARCMHKAGAALDAGDPDRALAHLENALDHDPGRRWLLRDLARLGSLHGHPSGVRASESLRQGAGPDHSPSVSDRVALVDAAVLGTGRGGIESGIIAGLRSELEAALDAWRSGPEARGACARLAALDMPGGAPRSVFSLIAGVGGRDAAALLDDVLAAGPGDGLVLYLKGRAEFAAGRYAAAALSLGQALDAGWPEEAVRAGAPACLALFRPEIDKTVGMASFWAGRLALARAHLSAALETAPYEGDRLVIEEYLARLHARLGQAPNDPADFR
jgi:tetratricopeptide (TPR) repeat protein